MVFDPADHEDMAMLRKAIMGGLHPRSAAISLGIPDATYYDWMAKPDFSAAVKGYVNELKAELAAVVMASATKSKNWVAAMTMLERLFPDEYGRRDRVTTTHEGAVRMDIRPVLADPSSIHLLAQLEERQAQLDEAGSLGLPAHEDDEASG